MMLTMFKWCLSGPVGQRSRDQGRVGRPFAIASFFHEVVGFSGGCSCYCLLWLMLFDICWKNYFSRSIFQPAVQCLETKIVPHISSVPIQPNLPEMRMGDNSGNLLPWDRLWSAWPKSTQLWSTWLWLTWPVNQILLCIYSIYAFFLYVYKLNCPNRAAIYLPRF